MASPRLLSAGAGSSMRIWVRSHLSRARRMQLLALALARRTCRSRPAESWCGRQPPVLKGVKRDAACVVAPLPPASAGASRPPQRGVASCGPRAPAVEPRARDPSVSSRSAAARGPRTSAAGVLGMEPPSLAQLSRSLDTEVVRRFNSPELVDVHASSRCAATVGARRRESVRSSFSPALVQAEAVSLWLSRQKAVRRRLIRTSQSRRAA